MATEAGSIFVRVGADTAGFDRGMRRVDSSLGGVRRSFGGAESSANRFARTLTTGAILKATAVLGTAGLLGAIGKVGFSFNALRENAQVAFTTMLGSGQKAKKFLDELQEFAERTPFEFKDLLVASQRLLAVGFEAQKVIPVMTAVGDAVAAMGGDPEVMARTVRAIGQIQSKGRLMAEEMMQLNEAGTFSWKALAKEIGKSVPEAMDLVTKGAVSADAFMLAFTRNSARNFKDMMEKQSHTFSGMMSTLKDKFAAVSATAMKPFFELAKEGMEKLIELTNKPGFHAGMERFGDFLRAEVIPRVRDFFGWFVEHKDAIGRFASGAVSAMRLVSSALKTAFEWADKIAQKIGGWDTVLSTVVVASLVGKFARIRGAIGAGSTAGSGALGIAGALGLVASRMGALAGLAAIPIIFKIGLDIFAPPGKQTSKDLASPWQQKVLAAIFSGAPPFELAPGSQQPTALDLVTGRTAAQIPTSFGDTHGARGMTAFDQARGPMVDIGFNSGGGVVIRSPNEDTVVTDLSGKSPELGGKPGGAYGYSVYLASMTGTYFITHLAKVYVKRFQRLKPGTPIGWTANAAVAGMDPKASHAHVEKTAQIKLPGGTTVPTGDEDGGGVDLSGDVPTGGGAGKGGNAGAKPSITALPAALDFQLAIAQGKGGKAQLPVLRQIRDLYIGRLDTAKPEDKAELQRAINETKGDIRTIAKEIADAGDEEFAKAMKRAKAAGKWERAVIERFAGYDKVMREKEAELLAVMKAGRKEFAEGLALPIPEPEKDPMSVIDTIMAAGREKLGKLGDALKAGLQGATAKATEALADWRETGAAAIGRALDAMQQTVASKRAAVADAFGTLMDKALRIFDRKTQDLVAKARAKVTEFGFEIGAGEETPAERRLRAFRERLEGDRLSQDRAAADAIEDPAERARRVRELDLQDQERALVEEARLERQAADEALAIERQRIEAERELLQQRFTNRFNLIVKSFQDETITAQQAQTRITLLFEEFGSGVSDAAILGEAFAESFKDAMDATTGATWDLVRAVNSLAEALSRLRQPEVPSIPSPEWTREEWEDMRADWVGAIGGRRRARGGPVSAYTSYIVGERGPELFIPGTRGMILPGGAGGSSVTIIVQGSLIHERQLEDVVARAAQGWSYRNGPLLSRTAGGLA